jgi:hypothetical protein
MFRVFEQRFEPLGVFQEERWEVKVFGKQDAVTALPPFLLRETHPAAIIIKEARVFELLNDAPRSELCERVFPFCFADDEELPRLDVKRRRCPPGGFNQPLHIRLRNRLIPKLLTMATALGDRVENIHYVFNSR